MARISPRHLLIFLLLLSANSIFAQYTWVKWGDVNTARMAFSAMKLSENEILVFGGIDDNLYYLASSEIINIANKTVVYGDDMKVARAYMQCLFDKDSNIIAIGGLNSSLFSDVVERFDRKTRTWSILGNTNIPRYQFACQFINDTEILIIGGFTTASCEIFNIKTGLSRNTANYPYITTDNKAAISSKGNILAFGGRQSQENSYRSADVYKFDKSGETFSLVTAMSDAVQNPGVLRLDDGRVFVYGGGISEIPAQLSNQILIETNNQFSKVGAMTHPCVWGAGSQINANEVLMASGIDENTPLQYGEVFNLNTNATSLTTALVQPCLKSMLITMPPSFVGNNNRVYLISGSTGSISSPFPLTTVIQSLEEIAPPPQIADIVSDCYSKTYTVTASDVSKASLTSSFNASSYISPKLPSPYANITLSATDKSKNAYFTISVTNTSGKSIQIIDSITVPGRISSVSPLVLSEFVMDETFVSSSSSKTITAYNSTDNDAIIYMAKFVKGAEFSLAPGQFSMPLNKKSSANIVVNFSPTDVGERTDTLILITACDTFKVAVSGTGKTLSADAPVVTAQTSDCANKTYTVQSKDYDIKEIAVVSADNANVTYSPNPPSMTITISANLIDGSKNGSFKIKITTKAGKELYINDAISASSSLSASYPLGKSYYRLDSTGLGRTIYKDVEITNSSSSDLIIDNAYFIYNTEYSVMPSQLPITISANSVGEIKVAFNPTTLKERIDTLYISQACGIMKIPFNTICKANIYDINGECDAQITTTSSAITPKYLSVSPNPAVNVLKVKMKLPKEDSKANFKIVNSNGEEIQVNSQLTSQNEENGAYIIEYQIDISKLNCGVYQLVYNGEKIVSQSFVVDK